MGGNAAKGLELYGWNARMSAALMLPAHFAEISTRNAAADVLERVYGPVRKDRELDGNLRFFEQGDERAHPRAVVWPCASAHHVAVDDRTAAFEGGAG